MRCPINTTSRKLFPGSPSARSFKRKTKLNMEQPPDRYSSHNEFIFFSQVNHVWMSLNWFIILLYRKTLFAKFPGFFFKCGGGYEAFFRYILARKFYKFELFRWEGRSERPFSSRYRHALLLQNVIVNYTWSFINNDVHVLLSFITVGYIDSFYLICWYL